MNSLTVAFLGLLCCSVTLAALHGGYYRGGHKSHYLGGAHYGYGYRPLKYASHGVRYAKPVYHHAAPVVYSKPIHHAPVVYSKPIVHHAPVVYSKPHYAKPAYHHSAPSYHLGGHGYGYKPVSYGYHARPLVYSKYHH